MRWLLSGVGRSRPGTGARTLDGHVVAGGRAQGRRGRVMGVGIEWRASTATRSASKLPWTRAASIPATTAVAGCGAAAAPRPTPGPGPITEPAAGGVPEPLMSADERPGCSDGHDARSPRPTRRVCGPGPPGSDPARSSLPYAATWCGWPRPSRHRRRSPWWHRCCARYRRRSSMWPRDSRAGWTRRTESLCGGADGLGPSPDPAGVVTRAAAARAVLSAASDSTCGTR